MSKVTSKYQITLPRRIARAHHIEPGTEIEFTSTGNSIQILLEKPLRSQETTREEALRSFDESTKRISERQDTLLQKLGKKDSGSDRGWTRDELYRDRIEN